MVLAFWILFGLTCLLIVALVHAAYRIEALESELEFISDELDQLESGLGEHYEIVQEIIQDPNIETK